MTRVLRSFNGERISPAPKKKILLSKQKIYSVRMKQDPLLTVETKLILCTSRRYEALRRKYRILGCNFSAMTLEIHIKENMDKPDFIKF